MVADIEKRIENNSLVRRLIITELIRFVRKYKIYSVCV